MMSRILAMVAILTITLSAEAQKRSTAQEADAYRFAPPPPPPLDDYEEMDDESFETDEAFRPPPPPLPPGTAPGLPAPGTSTGGAPPTPDFRQTNEAYTSAPGKFRFRVVDGEYWEKGKKRTRGQQMIGRSSQ